MNRPILVVLCGPGFSGKTTLAFELHEDYGFKIVSVDWIHGERGNDNPISDEQWQSAREEAYRRTKEHLAAGEGVVFDDTGSTKALRKAALGCAGKAVAVLAVLKTDSEEVLRRAQKNREEPTRHDVPDEILLPHLESFEWPKPSERFIEISPDLTTKQAATRTLKFADEVRESYGRPADDLTKEERLNVTVPGIICSIGVAVMLCTLAYVLQAKNSYAGWLFVATPFLAGLACGTAMSWQREVRAGLHWNISMLVYGIIAVPLICIRFEGVVCILMAVPVVIPMHFVGSLAGGELMHRLSGRSKQVWVSFFPLAAAAVLGWAKQDPPPYVRTEATTIDIDASPEEVWPLLFNLPEIGPDSNLLFNAGVAHPTSIRSDGQFVGSRRDCLLSTGVMTERISAIDPLKRMRFDVLQTPPPLRELNPFGEVKAAHQHGYFTVKYGEFRLIPLANGKTRLVGTSQYSCRIFPAVYWQLWNDRIVENIHQRVMQAIKLRAEKKRTLK